RAATLVLTTVGAGAGAGAEAEAASASLTWKRDKARPISEFEFTSVLAGCVGCAARRAASMKVVVRAEVTGITSGAGAATGAAVKPRLGCGAAGTVILSGSKPAGGVGGTGVS